MLSSTKSQNQANVVDGSCCANPLLDTGWKNFIFSVLYYIIIFVSYVIIMLSEYKGKRKLLSEDFGNEIFKVLVRWGRWF